MESSWRRTSSSSRPSGSSPADHRGCIGPDEPHLIHLPLTVTHVADDIMPHHSKHGTPQLPVPEMRFEQKYLSSIAPYIHTEYKPVAERETSLSEEEHLGGAYEKVEVREKQRQLVKETRVQWGRVILRTTFDQVVSPMLQGLVLCVPLHIVWRLRAHLMIGLFWVIG